MPKCNLAPTKVHKNVATIYDALDRAIRLYNYRQEDVAKILGVKQNTVSHHMKHHTFDQDQLNELFDHFGLEIQVCAKQSQ